MTALRLRAIEKSFGASPVLRGVSLDVESGEFVALLGASGSGKSTLLRIIAGLERADAGTVWIDDADVTRAEPGARDLAMVFQSHALYPQMTVAQNIALPLEMRRLAAWQRLPGARLLPAVQALRAAIVEDVRRAAAMVGIEHKLDQRPGQLSGGQRQRAALARALVRRPRLLLMDEPLSSLDARLRQRMRGEIAELHRTSRATIIYVTHDQVEAMTLADRIAVVVDGRIVQVGPPQALYADPEDIHVAEMLGEPAVNVLAASTGPDGLQAGGVGWGPACASLAGRSLRLAFRPERTRIDPRGAPAEVRRVEATGAETLVHARLATGEAVVLRGGDNPAPAVGEALRVWAPPEALMLFGEDGARIRDGRP